jgi:hypothetical protein
VANTVVTAGAGSIGCEEQAAGDRFDAAVAELTPRGST